MSELIQDSLNKLKSIKISNPELDLRILINYTKNIKKDIFLSNFREKDIEYGGTGAPLDPFLDWLLFKNLNKNIITINIGGISNLTYVTKDGIRNNVIGFDTGPGMSLIDEASKLFFRSKLISFSSKFDSIELFFKYFLSSSLSDSIIYPIFA